jgi:hypothetical protein
LINSSSIHDCVINFLFVFLNYSVLEASMTDLEMSQKQEEWLDCFSLFLFLCHNISSVSSIRFFVISIIYLELELLFCTKTICYPCYHFFYCLENHLFLDLNIL